jgi:hypothetical protein
VLGIGVGQFEPRRSRKLPPVSFKSSKIIRYHYAFDPNPDRLTKAFLDISCRYSAEFLLLFSYRAEIVQGLSRWIDEPALLKPPVNSLAASSACGARIRLVSSRLAPG